MAETYFSLPKLNLDCPLNNQTLDKNYSLQKCFKSTMNINFFKSTKLLNGEHPLEVKGAFSEFS